MEFYAGLDLTWKKYDCIGIIDMAIQREDVGL